MWLVKAMETVLGISLSYFGVFPREIELLPHIFSMPFVHGSWEHLYGNSVPLIVLMFLILQSYRHVASRIIGLIYVGSGLGIWLFGRSSFHIGASGMIYGLAAFIFFSGIFRRDVKSIALALFVSLFYGGMVWGILPLENGVSWEGHLFGALVGGLCAYRYRSINPPKRYEWEGQTQTEPAEVVEQPYWVPPQTSPSKDIPIRDGNEAQGLPPKSSNDILNWEVKYNFKPNDRKE